MTISSDIAIVGGGLSGALMALSCSHYGFSVCVIDAGTAAIQKTPNFDGRSYAMAHSSVKMLITLGVWPDIKKTAQPILDIKISDGAIGDYPSPFMLHFDHHDLEDGPLGYMLEDRILRPSLQKQLENNDFVTYLDQSRVVSHKISSAGVNLRVKGKAEAVRAKLVISADGRNSNFAKEAGISYVGWRYLQTSQVCALEHEKSHEATAYQHFMPSGPLAILPLRGNRCSIVWTETTMNSSFINKLDDDAYLEILRPRFGDFLGEIKLVGKRFSYPLDICIAKKFIVDRVALIGDAAHGMHPIAGQGLNAGLRDIATLSQVIKEAKERGEDFATASVLYRYQEWRRFDATALSLALDGFNTLFSNNIQFLKEARRLGLGIVNKFPSLKRSLMIEAAGLSGDLPDLMH